ncbi:MAG: PorP/SprF family type IX secretion system membrane protein [Bacteroidales bacterium]
MAAKRPETAERIGIHIKMREKLLHIFLVFFATALPVWSQVNSFSDQYLSNLFLLNPAIAGTAQYSTLTVNSRQQWIGWDGAPASQSVTFHSRLARSKDRFTPLGFINKGKNTYSKVGFGGGFFHDSYGVFNLTGIHLDYSYQLMVGKGRLSLGLAPSVFQVGTTSVVLADPSDPYLNNPNKSYFVDFNAGVHYFSKNGYMGLSLVQLFNSSVKFGSYGYPGDEDPSLNPQLARSAYAYGGYFFMLNRDMNLKVEPMGLVKYNSRTGLLFDVSTTVHLRDMFSAGASYRLKQGLSVFLGVRLDNLALRYQFEIPVSTEVGNRYSSHTIQISLNIGQPID